jgi:carbon-monoxide dehydrogenase medium subunit
VIRDFAYFRAKTRDEALDCLDEHKDDCKVICGGQSLLILMRQGLVAPKNLIDIKAVKELSYIDFHEKNGLKIGATTTHREIEKSLLIKEHCPLLADMEQNLASIQTRNWGSIGGNLAHADPAGDPGPVLIALNASVKMANRQRERTMPVEEFFVDFFETKLEPGELLLEVQVPTIPSRTALAYEKFNIIKNELGIVSVAASITLDSKGTSCNEARIILGAVASTPRRAKEAEKLLIEQKLDDGLLERVGEKASEEADPVTDIHATEAYRRYLVKVLAMRMVKKAWEKAMALV